jgi:hypothetical protein
MSGRAAMPVAAPISPEQYAAERAAILQLEAEYLFALDWADADAYAALFTEDGTLEWARGKATGPAAIREEVRRFLQVIAGIYGDDGSGKKVTLRHFITNQAIYIDGHRAQGRVYWFEIANNGAGHTPVVGSYGHYEDEMRKVDGKWLFVNRRIFNEQLEGRRADAVNPLRTVEIGK